MGRGVDSSPHVMPFRPLKLLSIGYLQKREIGTSLPENVA